MTAQYVRAIHTFDSKASGDLNLHINDIVLVKHEIDHNWLAGTCRGKSGNFPRNFVKPVCMPSVAAGECLFVAIGTFPGEEMGDLSFKKGDVVIGTKQVDDNWWEGRLNQNTGIFPLTHVEPLPSSAECCEVIAEVRANSNLCAQLDDELSFSKGDTIQVVRLLDDGFAIGRHGSCVGTFPLSFVDVIKGSLKSIAPSNASSRKCLAEVESDTEPCAPPPTNNHHSSSVATAQFNGYSTFKKGHARKGSYTQANTSSHDAFVTPYAKSLYEFLAPEDDSDGKLSFGCNEIITLLRHVNDDWMEGEIDGRRGIFPTNYVDIIVDCQAAPVADDRDNGLHTTDKKSKTERTSGDTMHKTRLDLDSPGTAEIYARALYDFPATNPCDLSLVEGDTVTVIRRVDADWLEARHDDGRVGLCPVTYVEIFSFEPSSLSIDATEERGSVNSLSHNKESHNKIKPEVKPKPAGAAKSPTTVRPAPRCSLSEAHTSAGKPLSFGQCNYSLNLSLDDIIKNELLAATKVKENQTSRLPVTNAAADKRVGCPNSLNILAASSSLNAATDRTMTGTCATLPRSTPTHNTGTLSTCGSLDLDLDWLEKRELSNRSSVTNASQTVEPVVKKKPPAPPRPSVPLPPSKQSRSHWQIFEEQQNGSKSPSLTKRPAPPCPEPANRSKMDAVVERRSSATLPHSSSFVRSSLDGEDIQAAQSKRRETRLNVIKELLQTEMDYAKSLELCVKAFASTDRCPSSVDFELLLGNADEVLELSQRILLMLQEDVVGKPFEKQIVGRCFVTLKDDILRLYAIYCQNHDGVIALMQKYEAQPEVMEYFGRVLSCMRRESTIFDMRSILIKPVQRILKYPLLLNELDKMTEPDHADKSYLKTATAALTDVASAVNEYKRRKDLVEKYKNEKDEKLGDKLGKLTMRATRKKLMRFSQMMVGTQTIDENFIREEQKFKGLDSLVRNLTRDISQYIEHYQETVSCRDLIGMDITDYYDEQAPEYEIEKFCLAHGTITNRFFNEFKSEIESQVLPPLNSLLLLFVGPQKVIRKRYDKLLDYDNMSAKFGGESEQVKSHEDLQTAKRNYEALNAQLLDDLPKLYTSSLDVVRSCIKLFVRLQQKMQRHSLEDMLKLRGLPVVLCPSESSNIIEAFNIAHTIVVEQLSNMSFIPRTFNPLADDIRQQARNRRSGGASFSNQLPLVDLQVSSQPAIQRSLLQQKYAADKLFVVNRDFSGTQSMDLTVSTNTLVGVVKEGDPMGNKNKWFVDDGAAKGFMPKDYLKPYSSATANVDLLSDDLLGPLVSPLTPSRHSTSSLGGFDEIQNLHASPSHSNPKYQSLPGYSRPSSSSQSSSSSNKWMQFNSEDSDDKRRSATKQGHMSVSHESTSGHATELRARAMYAFTARNNMELSFTEGENLIVLQQRDLDGNSEWWHVKNSRGLSGYAPANYLQTL